MDPKQQRIHNYYTLRSPLGRLGGVVAALNGGDWLASRPGRALPRRKGPPAPIVQEAGWASELVWTQSLEEKFFLLYWGSNRGRPVV
jgi:hypothetical protein